MTSTAINNAAASSSITSGSHRAPQMPPYAAFPTDPSITGEQQPYHQTHNNHHHHHHSNTTVDPSSSSAPNPNVDPALDSPVAAAASSPPSHPSSAGFDMAPPPPSTHPSFTALHSFAQSHAAQHGYALSINTTAKNRSRIKLACVCYGQAKNTHKLTPETRVRKNRQSCKTGCRMWVEGKRRDDGSWVLRVGEPAHNHEGRGVEGWAVQRKRTWGVNLGRIGVGGVTAREERAEEEAKRAMAAAMGQGQGQGRARSGGAEGARQMEGAEEDDEDDEDDDEGQEGGVREPQMQQEAPTQTQTHSHESGGLVWQIVEQEMARKGGPGQGRDRGVGRTVKVLQERLPGIRIFKRDVYNIRAQIKRARKQAGDEVGDGVLDGGDNNNNNNDNDSGNSHLLEHPAASGTQDQSNNPANRFPEIDPLLVAQCNDALRHVGAGPAGQEAEAERLRRENEELKAELAKRIKDAEEKAIENQRLKVELEMVRLEAMYNRQGTT